MKRSNIIFRLLIVLLAIFPECSVFGGGPSANYHYFRTSNGGKVYCTIDNPTERTVKITSTLSCRYKDSKVISVTFSRNVVQEVSGDVTLPAQVNLRHCDELYGIDESVGSYSLVGLLDDSFKGCTNLTSITLPATVKSVASAFPGCTNLRTINLPTTIDYVSKNLAPGCDKLEAVNVGTGQGVKYHSFDGILCCEGEVYYCPASCKSDVVIPSAIKTIGKEVFANHSGLLSVNVNAGASIGEGAFKNCSNLKSVTLSNGVKSIDSNAFDGCASLEHISIPGSVKSLGQMAFQGCLSLSSIRFNEGIETINSKAFADCILLKALSFPVSLKNIYTEAFSGCSGIEEITFPTGCNCSYIGEGAFTFCSELNEIQLPANLEVIAEKAFMGCTALKNVVLNAKIKKIDRYAFFGCTNLTSINVPKGATTYEETFLQCDNLNLP